MQNKMPAALNVGRARRIIGRGTQSKVRDATGIRQGVFVHTILTADVKQDAGRRARTCSATFRGKNREGTCTYMSQRRASADL